MFETVDKNYDWFKSNLKDLCLKYVNRYVAIKDCGIVGAYDSFSSAYSDMLTRGETPGNFIIQLCTDDITKTMVTFHTHVITPVAKACA